MTKDSSDQLAPHNNEESHDCSSIEILKTIFENIEKLYEPQRMVTGIPTGFSDLDILTTGLWGGDLIIVAGRPGMGKTAFAQSIVQHAAMHAEDSVSAVIFTQEMTKEQMMLRILSSESRVEFSRLRTVCLGDSDWPKLTMAAASLSNEKLFIDDTPGITVSELCAKARHLKAKYDLGLIVIDSLQLLNGDHAENRQQEISEIARSLKSLAKELDIPVIVLSQLNRSLESRRDRRPIMADLREYENVEQYVDIFLFLYRESVYCQACNNVDEICDKEHRTDAEIIIGKHRNGSIGTIFATFITEFLRFEDKLTISERS